MKIKIKDIINKATDIDDADLNSKQFKPVDIFLMGGLYQFATPYIYDNSHEDDWDEWANQDVDMPDEFYQLWEVLK